MNWVWAIYEPKERGGKVIKTFDKSQRREVRRVCDELNDGPFSHIFQALL